MTGRAAMLIVWNGGSGCSILYSGIFCLVSGRSMELSGDGLCSTLDKFMA